MLKLVLIVVAVLLLLPALLVGLGSASPLMILVLLAILGFFYARRRSEWGSFAAQLEAVRTVTDERAVAIDAQRNLALSPSRSDRLRTRVERLENRRSDIAERLPADPLDCPDLVSCLSVLAHEAAEEREGVEVEYRRIAERFADWSSRLTFLRTRLGDADGLAADPRLDDFEDEAEALEEEIDEIASYVQELSARAREGESLSSSALEAAVRAGEALDRANAALDATTDAPPGARPALDEAAAKLGQAWEALEKGKERPRTAAKLAEEVEAAAAAVSEQLQSLDDLPADVEHGRRAFPERHAEVTRELDEARARFATAARSYPGSSWSEIEGILAEAQRELERAERLWPSDQDDPATALTTTGEAQREAFRALDEAAALVTRIAEHLDRLERAALDGREKLLAAEKEIDEAWAELAGSEGAERRAELLGRAGALAAEARSQLDDAKPDWLAVSELADRSLALARRARSDA